MSVPASGYLTDPTTDAGAAASFSDHYEGTLLYCPEAKQWYRRNRQVFEQVSAVEIQGLATEFMQAVAAGLPGGYRSNDARNLLSRARINAAVELSRAELSVRHAELDREKNLVGLADGRVFDLDNFTIVNEVSSIVTTKLGATYFANAGCPLWLKFLDHIFDGDKEMIAFLRRAIGYSLTGSVQEKCLFVLVGTGDNGKTTFIETMQRLFGQYAGTTPMQTLMVQRNEQTNDLARLVRKRFVSATETEHGQRLAENKIKRMTGGDTISCRALYQEYFDYKPQFKLWLATNDLPIVRGVDNAIWDRIIVVIFPVKISKEERIGNLSDQLAAELPGIFNWALEGLAEWRKQGLNPPEAVRMATGDYRGENDTVGQFIEACCERRAGAKIATKDLYEAYKSWCAGSGIDPIPNNVFGKMLGKKGFTKYNAAKGNGWIGLTLRGDSVEEVVAKFTS